MLLAVITKAQVALLSYNQTAKTEYYMQFSSTAYSTLVLYAVLLSIVLLAVLTKVLVALLSYPQTAETEYCLQLSSTAYSNQVLIAVLSPLCPSHNEEMSTASE